MKILMLDRQGNDFSLEKKVFAEEGADFTVTYFKDTDELKLLVKDADVVMFNDAPLTADIIGAMEQCKMIIRYGIGYDNVDSKAAGEAGIYVCNAPSYGTYDVAEHAMALLISACKHIPLADRCTRNLAWSPASVGKVRRLTGKTLGLVGFGRIARHVAKCAKGFEMDVLIYDPYVSAEDAEKVGVTKAELPFLLENSDYISLHSPLTDETHHMINEAALKKMKKEAVLINTGRGALVDERALCQALSDGTIAGAALDVYETEPIEKDNPLLTMDNVVLTPHVAWNSYEGVTDLHKEVTENVVRFLRGDKPINIVNAKFLKKE